MTKSNLKKYIDAQERSFDNALTEIKKGKKIGHWMWFIFPQILGLGSSEISVFYSLKNRSEAEEYFNNDLLKKRLIQISEELLELPQNDPVSIFGNIDSAKLKSSMTLFAQLEGTSPVFQKVLDKFFSGKQDQNTLLLLKSNS